MENNKTIELSTGNVTQKDGEVMTAIENAFKGDFTSAQAKFTFVQKVGEYGMMFVLPGDIEYFLERLQEIRNAGFSDVVIGILYYAFANKIKYVAFDCDADVSEEWPEFDW